MDKLEKYILDNKSEFEVQRSPEQGWNNLEYRMSPQKGDHSIWWKVAASIFLVSTVVLSVIKFDQTDTELGSTFSSHDSIEGFFVKMIDLKRAEYMELADESDSDELLGDIAQLDSAYAKLKISYGELEDQELLEAMLENLRLRVYILNEQIELLKNGGEENEEIYHSS